MASMFGVFLVVFVLLVVIPVGAIVSGGVVAAIIGWVLRSNAEQTHEGSELIETNY
ncbi:MAG: hypothetical protein IT195_08040 [Microthrixaceae bacterium]|nr:hypothetical protein [Microthrixaceae bacterium]